MKYLLMAAVIVVLLGALLSQAADLEVQVVDKDCWVEIYEDDKFDSDDPHLRLQGPQDIATLKNLKGRDWNDDIESVMVGPNAMVRAYSKKDFQGTELAFAPNQRIPDLAKLNMANDIESMKISCGRSQ